MSDFQKTQRFKHKLQRKEKQDVYKYAQLLQ